MATVIAIVYILTAVLYGVMTAVKRDTTPFDRLCANVVLVSAVVVIGQLFTRVTP